MTTSVSLHMAPRIGFEPTTSRLTAERSTIELSGIILILQKEMVRSVGLEPTNTGAKIQCLTAWQYLINRRWQQDSNLRFLICSQIPNLSVIPSFLNCSVVLYGKGR